MNKQLNPLNEYLDMLQTAIEGITEDAERLVQQMPQHPRDVSKLNIDSSNLKEVIRKQAKISRKQLQTAKKLTAVRKEQDKLVNQYSLTLREAIAVTNQYIEAAEVAIAVAQNNQNAILDLIEELR